MIEMVAAGRCGVSAPQISLSELHEGCNTDAKSRHPDCVAAMHRFCGMVSFPTAMTTLGVSREHTNGRIGMSCIRSKLSRNVPIRTLQGYHSGCTVGKSQHRDCLSAIHRYCQHVLGPQFAGTSQEIPGHDSLLVKCFASPRKERVHHNVLSTQHSGCTLPYSDSNTCYSAASRWCVQVGYSGGITQEVDHQAVIVACYNAEFSNDEFVTRNSAFYEAGFRVAYICGLDFDINRGNILAQTPQFLKTETYDNRASSVPLHSNFHVSKEFTETNSFTHSHSFTIGTEVSISMKLPFFGGGAITRSTSFTSGVSLTRQNTKTISYSTDSPVEVPAGQGIVKEAIVQKATLDVPWTARIVNALGVASTIGGQWRGVSTYNFRVTQRDIDSFCPCAM